MSHIEMKWKGSAALEDKSGVASFLVKGYWHDIPMKNFADAMVLHNILSDAFYQGHECGFNEATFYIEDTIKTRKFYNGYK